MARLQILELPEGSGDDRPPFVLVIDQVDGDAAEGIANAGLTTAELIGARAVLVFEETIDIPANDVPLDADGNPLFVKLHIEGDFEQFREQVQDEVRKAQDELRQAITAPTPSQPAVRNRCCSLAFETLGKQHVDDCPGPDA